MRKTNLRRLLMGTACVAIGGSAVAESALAAIDEIVVTTRKREENLQEIPVAVAAFNSEILDRQGLRDTKDILKLVPGVQFDNAAYANDTRITMRGINNSRGRASTAVLIDGIDTSGETITVGGGSSLLNTRLLDLERVEVIKGPQSALYGRNAFAGAINYITKKPNMDAMEGSLSAEIAEHGTYEVRGSISGPVVADKLALRVNAATYKTDGAYTNQNTGSDLNGAESDGIRVAALFTPTDSIDINAAVSYTESESDPRATVLLAANTWYKNGVALSDTMPELSAFGNQDYGQFMGTVDSVSESDVFLSTSALTGTDFAGSKDEALRASLMVDWDLGFATLKSTTGYLNNESSVREDGDQTDGLGSYVFGIGFSLDLEYLDDTETEYWSQEITLSSNEWGHGDWLVGVSGFWEDTDNVDGSMSWFNDPALAGSFLGSICQGGPPPDFACSPADAMSTSLPTKDTTRETTSWSIFGLVGLDVTDDLRVTAEARYIHDEIEVSSTTGINRVSQVLLGLPYTLGTTSLPVKDDVSSNTLNPRLAVDYKVNDDVMLYASAAKGTKPAGFGTAQFSQPADVRMKEEELWGYEVGAKTTWLDGSLQANIAAFMNVYTDRQIGITVAGEGGFPASGVTNAGEAETKGVELDMLWAPNDNLQIGLGYAYIDAEFTDFDFSELRADSPTPGATVKDMALCGNATGLCDGAVIAGVADHAATFSVLYSAPLANGDMEWFAGLNGQYLSERPLENAIVTPYVDSNINVDMQLGIQSDTWSVALFANNLLDDDTVDWAQRTQDYKTGIYGGAMGGEPRDDSVNAFLPNPRTVGIRASMKFGG